MNMVFVRKGCNSEGRPLSPQLAWLEAEGHLLSRGWPAAAVSQQGTDSALKEQGTGMMSQEPSGREGAHLSTTRTRSSQPRFRSLPSMWPFLGRTLKIRLRGWTQTPSLSHGLWRVDPPPFFHSSQTWTHMSPHEIALAHACSRATWLFFAACPPCPSTYWDPSSLTSPPWEGVLSTDMKAAWLSQLIPSTHLVLATQAQNTT